MLHMAGSTVQRRLGRRGRARIRTLSSSLMPTLHMLTSRLPIPRPGILLLDPGSTPRLALPPALVWLFLSCGLCHMAGAVPDLLISLACIIWSKAQPLSCCLGPQHSLASQDHSRPLEQCDAIFTMMRWYSYSGYYSQWWKLGLKASAWILSFWLFTYLTYSLWIWEVNHIHFFWISLY